ncbi:Uncharacterised protein [uncultured archaeon]|nr:Uncharacterised protein [uncultured archaeon]
MKLLKPFAAALLFVALSVYFTYYFIPSAAYLHLNAISELGLFISSPFNMSTEGNLLYNLYLPALLIFLLGFYLKNFNKAFQRKCSLRVVFVLSVVASYAKSAISIVLYNGYANYGISLGTSIIALSFIAAFAISLEVYVEKKEKYQHLYGRMMFVIISSLVVLLAALTAVSYFIATSSFIVHLLGLSIFLLLFIPFYERGNILHFMRKEETALESEYANLEKSLEKK